ncbi:hypothetical protein SAFG77S_04866 [Streptomyces afghaniensis]
MRGIALCCFAFDLIAVGTWRRRSEVTHCGWNCRAGALGLVPMTHHMECVAFLSRRFLLCARRSVAHGRQGMNPMDWLLHRKRANPTPVAMRRQWILGVVVKLGCNERKHETGSSDRRLDGGLFTQRGSSGAIRCFSFKTGPFLEGGRSSSAVRMRASAECQHAGEVNDHGSRRFGQPRVRLGE